MKFTLKSICVAAAAFAVCGSLPAAAEMRAADKCAGLSWNALASGACAFEAAVAALPPRDGAESEATELVSFEVPGVPEPQACALMLVGLAAIIAATRKRRRD